MNIKRSFFTIVAGLSWALSFGVQAQCFGGPQFNLYAGAQYLQGPLIASPAYYQPSAYYRAGSNVQLGQPPFFGGGLCSPGMMGPQLPQFHHGLTMPASPWASMIPQMLGGLGDIASGFMNNNNDETPLSYRDYLVRREIDQTLASGTRPAARTPAPSLENDGIFRELPMSNSAGTLGLTTQRNNEDLLPGEVPLESEEERLARLAGQTESAPVTETEPPPEALTEPPALPEDAPDLDAPVDQTQTVPAPEVTTEVQTLPAGPVDPITPPIDLDNPGREDISDGELPVYGPQLPDELPNISETIDPVPTDRVAGALVPPTLDEPPILQTEVTPTPEVLSQLPVALENDGSIYGPTLPTDNPVIIPSAEESPTISNTPPVLEPPTLNDTVLDVNIALAELPSLGQSPLDPCAVLRNTSPQRNHPIVNGALRTMATFYQSCEVLDIVLDARTPIPPVNVDVFEQENKINRRRLTEENRAQYIAHHPYLSRLQALQTEGSYPGPQCRNILDQPPIFSLGAKPEIRHSQNQIDINLFSNQTEKCQTSNIECDSVPVSAIDCSGFVQAALFASGLKVTKDQRNRRDLGTSGFLAAAHDPQTCIEPARFENSDSGINSIQPGDMIVGHDHHMYIIQSVGADPLGINRALENGQCQSITIDQFDFKLIQSGAGRSLGVAQMDTSFPAQSQILLNRLLFEAQKTCQEAQQNRAISPALVQTSRRTEFMVIRHKGSDDPECIIAPESINIEGEECIENCPQLEARS